MMSNKDYSFLGESEEEKAAKNGQKLPSMNKPNNDKYAFLGEPEGAKNEGETVDTPFGKWPKHSPQLTDPKSPEFRSQLEELISAGTMTPGMAMVGRAAMKGLPSEVLPAIGKKLAKLPEVIKVMKAKLDPSRLVKSVQQGHDTLHQGAVSRYQNVENEVMNRKVPQMTIYPDEIDEATKYLAKTKANQKLIEGAKKGEYKDLRQLQSDLGQEAERLKSSDSFAERNLGKEMFDQRQGINDMLKNHLESTGNKDLAEQLKEANDLYSKKHELYYDHNVIGKMVNPKTRKIPKNPMNVFSEQSEQMKRIIAEHPEISEELSLISSKKNISDRLKKYGKRGAYGTGATTLLGGAKWGYDKLTQG